MAFLLAHDGIWSISILCFLTLFLAYIRDLFFCLYSLLYADTCSLFANLYSLEYSAFLSSLLAFALAFVALTFSGFASLHAFLCLAMRSLFF
jgi:hypothetical protein